MILSRSTKFYFLIYDSDDKLVLFALALSKLLLLIDGGESIDNAAIAPRTWDGSTSR